MKLFESMLPTGFPGGSVVKESACQYKETEETLVLPLGQGDPLEEMATHSSILAWKIPRTEEPGGLQSIGHNKSDMTEQLSTHTCSLSSYC